MRLSMARLDSGTRRAPVRSSCSPRKSLWRFVDVFDLATLAPKRETGVLRDHIRVTGLQSRSDMLLSPGSCNQPAIAWGLGDDLTGA